MPCHTESSAMLAFTRLTILPRCPPAAVPEWALYSDNAQHAAGTMSQSRTRSAAGSGRCERALVAASNACTLKGRPAWAVLLSTRHRTRRVGISLAGTTAKASAAPSTPLLSSPILAHSAEHHGRRVSGLPAAPTCLDVEARMAPQLHACVAPQLHACVAPQLHARSSARRILFVFTKCAIELQFQFPFATAVITSSLFHHHFHHQTSPSTIRPKRRKRRTRCLHEGR